MTLVCERLPSDVDNSHRVTFVCTARMNYAGEELPEYQAKKSGDSNIDLASTRSDYCSSLVNDAIRPNCSRRVGPSHFVTDHRGMKIFIP